MARPKAPGLRYHLFGQSVVTWSLSQELVLVDRQGERKEDADDLFQREPAEVLGVTQNTMQSELRSR